MHVLPLRKNLEYSMNKQENMSKAKTENVLFRYYIDFKNFFKEKQNNCKHALDI